MMSNTETKYPQYLKVEREGKESWVKIQGKSPQRAQGVSGKWEGAKPRGTLQYLRTLTGKRPQGQASQDQRSHGKEKTWMGNFYASQVF